MNRKNIDDTLLGAICLLVGWGAATFLHECGHLAVAGSLGLPATLGDCTLTTGSVFVSGDMTALETALVAVAGSIVLIIIGLLLIRSRRSHLRMVGIVFLCRAWIDALPHCTDGAIMAESTGIVIAWAVAIIELTICGGAILNAISADRISRVRVPSSTLPKGTNNGDIK